MVARLTLHAELTHSLPELEDDRMQVLGTHARLPRPVGGGGNVATEYGDFRGYPLQDIDLRIRTGGNPGNRIVDSGYLPNDPADRLLCPVNHLYASVDLALGAVDQRFDLACRIRRALCKSTHFLGDNGKAAAAFAGPRRFDAGIQRQKVRLEGNLVDDADDLTDLFRRRLDVGHGADRLPYDLAALLDRTARHGGRLCSRPGICGIAAQLTRYLV